MICTSCVSNGGINDARTPGTGRAELAGWCTALQQRAQAAELHAAPLQPPAPTWAVQLLLLEGMILGCGCKAVPQAALLAKPLPASTRNSFSPE